MSTMLAFPGWLVLDSLRLPVVREIIPTQTTGIYPFA